MKVIVHQAVGVQPKAKAGDNFPKHSEKMLPVLVIQEDALQGVAPGSNVVEGSGKLNAQWASHGVECSSSRGAMQDLTPSAFARHAPIIVQEIIPGLDIRINVIGTEIFGASAITTTKEAELDCRIDPKVKWEKHAIGKNLQQVVEAFVKTLGLQYGSIDMRLTPEGTYVLFEINPSGQFLFIEIDTGHPLSNAMAALLLQNDVLH